MRRPELRDLPALRRRLHDEPPALRQVTPVAAHPFPVEIVRLVTPARQAAPAEQARETRLRREVIHLNLHEAQRRQHRLDRRRPLHVRLPARMQQIGELLLLRVALLIGEERVSLDQRHLRVALHRCGVKLVHLLDLRRRTLHRLRAGKHLAQHDGHLRVVRLQRRENQLQVPCDRLRVRVLLEIIRADEQHHAHGLEREHVLLQPDEHATRRVAADAAIGHLHAWECVADVIAPALCDGIAEENQRALILVPAHRPAVALLHPQGLEPIRAPDRARARQTIIGGWNVVLRSRVRCGGEGEDQRDDREERETCDKFHGE